MRTYSGARGRFAPLVALASSAALLALAAPALASPTASVTVAPIGSESHLLTLTNTGTQTITSFSLTPGPTPPVTNVEPAPACAATTVPVPGTLKCALTVAPGATVQLCYTGKAPFEFLPGRSVLLSAEGESAYAVSSTAAAVASCPVAGFIAPAPVRCKVPNVRHRTLAAARKALAKGRCAVGRIRRVKSSKVKRGAVVSQGTRAGRSLAKGTKVALVISRGRT